VALVTLLRHDPCVRHVVITGRAEFRSMLWYCYSILPSTASHVSWKIGQMVQNLKWRGDFTISKAYIFHYQGR
jgi:hypothetical protein